MLLKGSATSTETGELPDVTCDLAIKEAGRAEATATLALGIAETGRLLGFSADIFLFSPEKLNEIIN